MKTLRITVNGQTYDVQVEVLGQEGGSAAPAPSGRTRSAAIAAPTAAPAAPKPVATQATADGSVPSPLAAVVISVDIEAGAQVAEGDKLLTLEAMKMNTFVTAPKAGTVGDILVKAGDAVEEGQALITLN